MARGEERRISAKPSDAEQGGGLGIPTGAEFEVTDAAWTTWEEAGEKALKRDRKADDPALKIVVDVKGNDEPVTEFLAAGKAERGIGPSRDGKHLVAADNATATALNDSCNAMVFLNSIFAPSDPKKAKTSDAVKRHGKRALDEDAIDDGIDVALIGLKGVAGRIVIEREFTDGRDRGKPRPTLVVDEILAAPGGKGRSSGSSGSSRGRDRDRDDDKDSDRDERPARSARGSKDDDGGDEKDAEKVIVEVLDMPKYRKGIEVDRLFVAANAGAKERDNHKKIMAFIEDKDWVTDRDRPWDYDKKGDTIVAS